MTAPLTPDMLTDELRERFWSYVSVPVEWDDDACWLWAGALNSDGYGVFGLRHGVVRYAHRVQLVLSGIDVDGLVARHLCGTRACVRPDHIAVGTTADNVADTVRHGRVRHGEGHHRTRLTEAQVRGIRCAVGSHVEVASWYGVTPGVVGGIRNERSWRHVQ